MLCLELLSFLLVADVEGRSGLLVLLPGLALLLPFPLR